MKKEYIEILENMNIDKNTQFYKYFAEFGGFNNELDEFEEVMSIGEIYDYNFPSSENFWNEEYPNINQNFLMLSSIEGEGSYFYSIKDGKVYDVDFEHMDNLINGTLESTWECFDDFARDINDENEQNN